MPFKFLIIFYKRGMKTIHIVIFLIMAMNIFAHKLKLTSFIPEYNPTRTAVIVCPGGSYFWIEREFEGDSVASWLNSHGIAAFVLEYRHAGWAAFAYHVRLRGRSFPAGYEDLVEAIKYVRDNAEKFGVDKDRVGCIGFSAGGHLVMHAAEQLAGTTDVMNFVAAIYPVVSMTDACTHKRSVRGLLGEFPSQSMKDSLSLEKHVPSDCPPVFIVNCKDDPVVDYRNSILLDSALTAKGVSHRYVQYTTGGHGFGASAKETTSEAIRWKEQFLEWIFDWRKSE